MLSQILASPVDGRHEYKGFHGVWRCAPMGGKQDERRELVEKCALEVWDFVAWYPRGKNVPLPKTRLAFPQTTYVI